MKNKKNKFHTDLFRKWVNTLIKSLDETTDHKTKRKVMERCGKTCAIFHNEIEKIKAIKKKSQNIDEILTGMNQEKLWCGEWVKDGKTIYSICHTCGCPLIKSEILELSPTLCFCSLGWVKFVFDIILEKPVKVELEKSIGRGDNVCHFIVFQSNN